MYSTWALTLLRVFDLQTARRVWPEYAANNASYVACLGAGALARHLNTCKSCRSHKADLSCKKAVLDLAYLDYRMAQSPSRVWWPSKLTQAPRHLMPCDPNPGVLVSSGVQFDICDYSWCELRLLMFDRTKPSQTSRVNLQCQLFWFCLCCCCAWCPSVPWRTRDLQGSH